MGGTSSGTGGVPSGHEMSPAAVFSGDPVNSSNQQGKAAQLIDLDLPKLKARGVRYAVWNILCYSQIPFSQVEEVYALLQWGKDPLKGELMEPARSQLAFPLTGDQLTNYVCYLDLHLREMVYLDANLRGQVSSAKMNGEVLRKQMPAMLDYLKSLPSVYDLFKQSVDPKEGSGLILYSDKELPLNDVPAYVFQPENESNVFKPMDLNAILSR